MKNGLAWILVLFMLFANAGCAFIPPPAVKTTPRQIAVRPKSGASVIPRDQLGKIRNMVAVVVGISKYKFEGEGTPKLRNLRFAAADADALASHLVSSGFNAVDLLTNEKATSVAVRRAINQRVLTASEDDFVLLFWAGHGCADRKNPQNLYLLTHDADPSDLASTAYAMTDFRKEISAIKAQRLMVVIDTCYSGGVYDPTVAYRSASSGDVQAVLRGVYVANEDAPQVSSVMRLVFTSCEAGEVSRESSEYGHGVFTHFLLTGLQGDADENSDGLVTLGEAIEYTRARVRGFSGGQQNPATAGRFDRSIPMGVLKK